MPEKEEGKGESVSPEGKDEKTEEGEERSSDPGAALEESAEGETSEEGTPPEPTPFERMMEGVPKEERAAVLERYMSTLSDEEKGELPWVRERTQQDERLSERQASEAESRRQATTRELADRQSAEALLEIETHLDEVREGVIGGKNTGYDVDLLGRGFEKYAAAQAQIRNRGFISTISTTIVQLIEGEGDPLTNEDLQRITEDTGGTFQGILKGYMGELGRRRYEAGLEAGRKEAQSKDATWRASELAAIRSELQAGGDGGVETEPDAVTGVSESLEAASETVPDSASPAEKITVGIREHRRKGNKQKV